MRSRPVRIAIVGGSAASTPALFMTPELRSLAPELDVTLIGRSQERLRAVRRAIDLLSGERIASRCATDLADLRGADVVILQARYGGYDARARDESFPLRHGLCGDEGLGPGGFAAAWRSWPELSRALEEIQTRAPRAKVLLMTAPLSLLVRCAISAFPSLDVVGICELPWVTLRTVCASLRAPVARAAFSYAGVNHLGWFDELSVDGTNLVSRYAATCDDASFPTGPLIRATKAIPLKYLSLHYEPDAALRRQCAQPPRATELASIQREAITTFASSGRDEIAEALARRPTPWYSDSIAPYIGALAGLPASTVFFLSQRNDGYLPFLAAGDVLEQPFIFADGVRTRMERRTNLAPRLLQTLEHFVRYERLAARAVLADRIGDCADVLAAHPWLDGRRVDLRALSADLLAAV
jgi:6-phospho-beta-glucosidase